MEKFDITYFYGPPGFLNYYVDDEIMQAIVDCGFTAIPLATNRENLKRILGLMRKYGLKCNSVFETKITDKMIVSEDRDSFTQEDADKAVLSLVEDLKEYDDVITGWNVIDEPSANFFGVMQKIIGAFRRYSPEKELHINIWPNYANSDQLKAENYTEFLKKYMEEINPDYISFDYYHFSSPETTSDLARLFDNLEQVRAAGLEYGKDYMQIILLTKHLGYGNLTPYQLQWEVNMSLTYGSKRISYFTYWNDQNMERDGWENACMTSDGKKTEHYYEVQKINKWLLPLGTELFNKTSIAVFHLGDCSKADIGLYAKGYKPYGVLGECKGEDFVIGFFDDQSFMVMNKQYVEAKDGKKNAFTFVDIKDDLEYFDTDSASWKNVEENGVARRNEEGRYMVLFAPGQAYLFRKGKN